MGTINIIKLNYINCSDRSLYKSPSSPFTFLKPIGQALKKLRKKYERYGTEKTVEIKKERGQIWSYGVYRAYDLE